MPDDHRSIRKRFDLTPRQRRLRTLTWFVLATVIAMTAFGIYHPAFHRTFPAILTEELRRALVVKTMLVASYWTVCLLLVLTLVVFAWLDMREIRLQLLTARRDMWKGLAQKPESEQHEPPSE